MSFNWGPYFIVPSETLRTLSGKVILRETFDEGLLRKELEELNYTGVPFKAVNPWYYRKKGSDTWIKIGESDDHHEQFSVLWDTTHLENGSYEVLGQMHVVVKDKKGELTVFRENIAEVTVEN